MRGLRVLAPILTITAVGLVGPPPAGAGQAGGDEGEDAVPRVLDVEPRVLDVVARVQDLANGVPQQTTEETSEQVVINVSTDVLFAFDRADLTPEAQALLDGVATTVRDQATGTITIHGHTDAIGDPAYNQGLSELRAAAVRDALVPIVARNDLTYEVAGFGETQPIAPNENADGSDNPAGRQLNRRVTITFAKGA